MELGRSGTLMRMAASNAHLPELLRSGQVTQDEDGSWSYAYVMKAEAKILAPSHCCSNSMIMVVYKLPTPPDVAMATALMTGLHRAAVYYTEQLEAILPRCLARPR